MNVSDNVPSQQSTIFTIISPAMEIHENIFGYIPNVFYMPNFCKEDNILGNKKAMSSYWSLYYHYYGFRCFML